MTILNLVSKMCSCILSPFQFCYENCHHHGLESLFIPALVTFYYCDKTLTTNNLGEGQGLFVLSFCVTDYHWGKPRQKLETWTKVEAWENNACWLLLLLASWFLYVSQDHLPRDDTAYNLLTFPPATAISTPKHSSRSIWWKQFLSSSSLF